MRVWMSKKARENNGYAARIILPIMGSTLLACMVVIGGTVVAICNGWSILKTSVVIYLLASVIVIVSAVNIDRVANRDTLIFFKDYDDNLFVLDLRRLVKARRGTAGYFSMVSEIGQIQEQMKLNEFSWMKYGLPIVSVESLKERTNSYACVCIVRYPNDTYRRQTYILQKGYEQESELILALERRKQFPVSAEVKNNPYPIRILVSALALVLMITLCVLSHPAFGVLPQVIYFPCLGIVYVPVWFLGYYILKQKRGE